MIEELLSLIVGRLPIIILVIAAFSSISKFVREASIEEKKVEEAEVEHDNCETLAQERARLVKQSEKLMQQSSRDVNISTEQRISEQKNGVVEQGGSTENKSLGSMSEVVDTEAVDMSDLSVKELKKAIIMSEILNRKY